MDYFCLYSWGIVFTLGFVFTATPEAEGKTALVRTIIGKMYRNMVESIGLAQIVSFIKGSTKRRRQLIYETLSTAHPLELNYIITHVNCPMLMECAGQPVATLLTSSGQDGRLLDLELPAR